MTVSSSVNKSGPYAGAGIAGPFTVGFRFLSASHLRVIKTSTAGVDTDLTLTTDYTVFGVGASSGSVTLTAPLLPGEKLTIVRDVPFTQEADYVANDPFPAESHEAALDLLTMQTQQLKERTDAALTLPERVTGVSTELPAPVGGNVIGWDEEGKALRNIDPATLASIIAYSNRRVLVADGGAATYTLDADPGVVANTLVIVSGVVQTPGVDYAISGVVLTPTTAFPAGTGNVVILYGQALPVGTVAADQVNYTAPWTNARQRTQDARNREELRLTDFTGIDPTGTTDSTAAFVTAMGQSVGKRLYIPEGTYIINTPSFGSAYRDIDVVGAGRNTVLKAPAGSAAPVLRLEGAYEIRFSDLVFDGNAGTQTVSTARTVRIGTGSRDIDFDRVIFQNNYTTGLFATGTSGVPKRVNFTGCQFLGSTAANSSTVNIVDFEDFAFLGCYFADWVYDALATSFFQTTQGGLRVIGCNFLNSKPSFFAIETVASGTTKEFRLRRMIVACNVFDGGNQANGGSGISSTHDDVTIIGNTWRNSGAASHRNGVEATGSNWTIVGNTFDNGSVVIGSTTGDVTTNFTVKGNIIKNRGVSTYAVLIGGVAATECRDLVVSDNVIDMTGSSGSGGGIYAGTYGSPAIVKRLTVANNTITKTDTTSGIAIRLRGLAGSESWRVYGNTASGLSQGIRTDDSATDVEISRNNLAGCPTPFLFTHTTGVWRIYDNWWSKTAQHGVSDDRGDANVTIIAGQEPEVQVFNTPLTLARTVTLSTSYVTRGAKFRIVRTAAATGASTLSVGGLKTLAAGQWADVSYNGSAWMLTAFGSL